MAKGRKPKSKLQEAYVDHMASWESKKEKIEAEKVSEPPKAQEPQVFENKEYRSHPKFDKFKKGTI